MNFSLLVCGAPSVGKSCFVNRMLTGNFSSVALAAPVLTLNTNYGMCTFTIHESSVYIPGCDAEIILYDTTNPNILPLPATNAPRVVMGTKADGRVVPPPNQCSARYNHNLQIPYLSILRQLVAPGLVFIDMPAVTPPIIHIAAFASPL